MSTLLQNQYDEHIKRWRLNELTAIVDEFDSVFAERVHHKLILSHDYQNILFRLAGKSIITFREIICMATFGYPDGALSLSRNLYEQFITLSFFGIHIQDRDFEKYIQDYYADYDIKRCKALEYGAEHYQKNLAELNRLKAQRKSIKDKAYHKGNGDYWWTGKGTFTNVALDIQKNEQNPVMRDFLAELHLIYKRACMSLHASCIGNTIRLGVDSDFVGVDTSPQANGHELALYIATSSFIMIVGTICKEFQLNYTIFKDRLHDLMQFYRKLAGSEYTNV